MLLSTLIDLRRQKVIEFLRSYHGPAWREVLKARGVEVSHPNSVACLCRLERYAYSLGLRYRGQTVTTERIQRTRRASVEIRKRAESRLIRSSLSAFILARDAVVERAVSLAKAGHPIGFPIPSGVRGPKIVRKSPEIDHPTGGISDPRDPLSGPRAILKPAREALKSVLKRMGESGWGPWDCEP